MQGIQLSNIQIRDAALKNNDISMQLISQGAKTIELLSGIRDSTSTTAINTGRLANIEKSLSSIDTKMNNSANDLAANGRK
jgi:hypothetical protein